MQNTEKLYSLTKKHKGALLTNNADLGKYSIFTFYTVFPHLSKNVLVKLEAVQ